MKFIICRASNYYDSPWEGAVKEPCRRTEHLWLKEHEREAWWAEGYNPRFEEPYAVRDVDCERWWINVEGLADLLNIIEQSGHGVVVDRDKGYVDNPLVITIYDSYLE